MKTICFISLFFCGILLVSCDQNSPPTTTNEVHFDGNTYHFDYIDLIANYVIPMPGNIKIMYGNQLSQSSTTPYPFLGIVCGFNQFTDTTAALENIQSYFHTGTQPYMGTFINNGVGITIYGSTFGEYTSNIGSQPGSSSFSFTQVTYHNGNPSYVDYTCEFSCMVTNMSDSTDIKPIDGTVSGRFNSEY